jgi:hypothetical protein
VAGDERQARAGQLTVDDVEVGAADAAGADAQQDPAGRRLGVRQVAERERLARRDEHGRAHG